MAVEVLDERMLAGDDAQRCWRTETKRVQCPWVSEEEVQRVSDCLRAQGEHQKRERCRRQSVAMVLHAFTRAARVCYTGGALAVNHFTFMPKKKTSEDPIEELALMVGRGSPRRSRTSVPNGSS